MSHNDEECHITFRISEVDENTIYFRERGITNEKNFFKVPLPKDKTFCNILTKEGNE